MTSAPLVPDLDPSSWNLRYRRATAYISLGRHSPAIEDLDAIIRLNPKFTQARLQKGKILAKEGQFKEAKEEIRKYLKEAEKADPAGLELVSPLNSGFQRTNRSLKLVGHHRKLILKQLNRL